MSKSNPYSKPVEGASVIHRHRRSKRELAVQLAASGFGLGGLLGAAGYIPLVLAFEMLLTPPLVSPANFGQFGFVLLGAVFYLSLLGASIGLIPLITLRGYIPAYVTAIVSLILMNGEFFNGENWLETPIVAMLTLFAFPLVAAIIIGRWFADP